MSTLQCGNIVFESTGNNRVQYFASPGNVVSFVVAGSNSFVVNSTVMLISPGGTAVMNANTTVVAFAGATTFAGSITSGNVVVQTKTANTYTLQASDSGTLITFNNTTVSTVTIPTSLPVGFRCHVLRLGTANITFVNASSVTMYSATTNSVAVQYGTGSVISYAANTYILSL